MASRGASDYIISTVETDSLVRRTRCVVRLEPYNSWVISIPQVRPTATDPNQNTPTSTEVAK